MNPQTQTSDGDGGMQVASTQEKRVHHLAFQQDAHSETEQPGSWQRRAKLPTVRARADQLITYIPRVCPPYTNIFFWARVTAVNTPLVLAQGGGGWNFVEKSDYKSNVNCVYFEFMISSTNNLVRQYSRVQNIPNIDNSATIWVKISFLEKKMPKLLLFGSACVCLSFSKSGKQSFEKIVVKFCIVFLGNNGYK